MVGITRSKVIYTHQLVRKPIFRPTSVYTNHLLHQPTFTHQLLHKSAFTPTSFYTNKLLEKQPFAQTTSYSNHLLQPSFYTHHFFDKPVFYTNQLYTTPARGPLWAEGQRAGGMPKAPLVHHYFLFMNMAKTWSTHIFRHTSKYPSTILMVI